jgi:hypothetical protein
MALPLWDPLCAAARSAVNDARDRALTALVTAVLGVLAAGLMVSAGLVALSRVIGFPLAGGLLGVALALLALAVHLSGGARARRRAERIAQANDRARADLAQAAALAGTLARAARPILPVAAFLAAFLLAQRR